MVGPAAHPTTKCENRSTTTARESPLPRPDVGDVGHPCLVRLRRCELSLKKIEDQDRRLTDRPASLAIPMQSARVSFAHQPFDALLAERLAGLAQVEKDSRCAVDAVTRGE